MVSFCQILTVLLLLYYTPPSGAVSSDQNAQGTELRSQLPRRRLLQDSIFYPDDEVFLEEDLPLVRHARAVEEETTESAATPDDGGSKSVFEKIEEFYSDNNNLAMYCVLPVMVLVYGGCSVIYCIYKLRRYLRRRKHKRLRSLGDSFSYSSGSQCDLNENAGQYNGGQKQGLKTVTGGTWADDTTFSDVRYEGDTKKSPLPWNTPPKIAGMRGDPRQVQKTESFVLCDRSDSSRDNFSVGSDSVSLEREREKLDSKSLTPEKRQGDKVEAFMREKKLEEIRGEQQKESIQNVRPIHKGQDMSRLNGSRPIEIVPITQSQYQRHLESQSSNTWDPLHNKPFDSRTSSAGDPRSGTGRESAWSIRDEIMAKYDALTSLAMAKKTADILQLIADEQDKGHRPDTLRRKPRNKAKLLFIAE